MTKIPAEALNQIGKNITTLGVLSEMNKLSAKIDQLTTTAALAIAAACSQSNPEQVTKLFNDIAYCKANIKYILDAAAVIKK